MYQPPIYQAPDFERDTAVVSSALALDILRVAYRYAQRFRGQKKDCFRDPPDAEQLELRQWLAASGLAQKIAGIDQLPDIAEHARGITRVYYQLTRPRNHKELVFHVMRHLDWYIAPPASSDSKLGLGCAALLVFAAVYILLPLLQEKASTFGVLIGVIISVLVVFGLAVLALSAKNIGSMSDAEKSYEFYRYLLGEYADTDKDQATAGMP